MMGMSLQHLLEDWATNAPDVPMAGLCLDSRQVTAGDIFVAVQGGSGHGMDHAAMAVNKGCVAILHDGLATLPDVSVPLIEIQGLGQKIPELASRLYGAPSEHLSVAGVTGTNGKTSVAHFLAQAWSRYHGDAGLIGTLGYGSLKDLQEGERTTPDAISLQKQLAICVSAGVEYVAMEVSSHALVQGRCNTVQFDVAVFTNLSRDHLDYHGSMEAYGEAKRRLFTEHAPRFAVINSDDPYGHVLVEELQGQLQVMSYGFGEDAEVRAEILAMNSKGILFRLVTPWGEADIQSSLMGRFNVANLMAAATTMALLGMPWHQIIHQLEVMQPVPGRMVRLGGEDGQPVVVVDYAHTPDALEHALMALHDHLDGQLVCVFGCGGNRDSGKRAEMGRIAQIHADRIVVTSDNPRDEDAGQIIDDVLAGLDSQSRVLVEADRAKAIQQAISSGGSQDIILIAGKGHESYQEIAGAKLPFNDEEVVRELLEAAA